MSFVNLKFTANLFQKQFSQGLVNQLVANRLRTPLAHTIKLFKGTVATWTHKPKFIGKITRSGYIITLLVYTEDDIYRFVNDGVAGHIIVAKSSGSGFGSFNPFGVKTERKLKYQSNFAPKTFTGHLYSEAGAGAKLGTYESNSATIFVKGNPGIAWPGITPRAFDQMIAEMIEPEFTNAVSRALYEALGSIVGEGTPL